MLTNTTLERRCYFKVAEIQTKVSGYSTLDLTLIHQSANVVMSAGSASVQCASRCQKSTTTSCPGQGARLINMMSIGWIENGRAHAQSTDVRPLTEMTWK